MAILSILFKKNEPNGNCESKRSVAQLKMAFIDDGE